MLETRTSYYKNDWHVGKEDLAEAELGKDVALGRK